MDCEQPKDYVARVYNQDGMKEKLAQLVAALDAIPQLAESRLGGDSTVRGRSARELIATYIAENTADVKRFQGALGKIVGQGGAIVDAGVHAKRAPSTLISNVGADAHLLKTKLALAKNAEYADIEQAASQALDIAHELYHAVMHGERFDAPFEQALEQHRRRRAGQKGSSLA